MPPAVATVPLTWRTARGALRLERPVLLGILNVTPDSFSDGGLHHDVGAAVRHAERMVAEGADIIDIGGESTRPGAQRVGAADEIARVLPVLQAVRARMPDVPISIDTVKSDVAQAAIDAGADIINDVSALRLDPRMAELAARTRAGLILMHSRGTVEDMASYARAEYPDDPVAVVLAELTAAVRQAQAAGVSDDAIVIDPGLGFAKRTQHSLALLAGVDRLTTLAPVLVGPSRKRFIGEAAGGSLPVEARLEGTLAACVLALAGGARLFRIHDVAPARRALDFAHAALAMRSR